jgi:hypothetical protein
MMLFLLMIHEGLFVKVETAEKDDGDRGIPVDEGGGRVFQRVEGSNLRSTGTGHPKI